MLMELPHQICYYFVLETLEREKSSSDAQSAHALVGSSNSIATKHTEHKQETSLMLETDTSLTTLTPARRYRRGVHLPES